MTAAASSSRDGNPNTHMMGQIDLYNPRCVNTTAQYLAESALVPHNNPGTLSNPSTWVMSPSTQLGYGAGQGWLTNMTPQCPSCGFGAMDPFICASCGKFGHPQCLGAELFQGIPICGNCFIQMMSEYSARENAAKREEWRKLKSCSH